MYFFKKKNIFLPNLKGAKRSYGSARRNSQTFNIILIAQSRINPTKMSKCVVVGLSSSTPNFFKIPKLALPLLFEKALSMTSMATLVSFG